MTRGRVLPVLLQVLLGLLAIAATQPSSSPSHPGGGGGQQPASHHHSQPARHQGSSQHQHRRHHPRQKEGAMDISALPEPERKHFLDALESNLMTTFGITRKPKSKQGRTIHIPKRMQLLYEQLNGYGEGTLEEQLQRRRNRVRRAPGNTIRSFSYTDLGNVTGGLNIGFDMNSFPDTESLNEAHLQILHKPTEDTHQQLHNQSDSSHVIDIYQVIQPESQSRSSSSGESITRLVDTKTVQSRQRKWHTFDISSAVHEWRKTPGVNHGLQVSVRTAEGRKSPFAGHVRLRRSAQQADMEWAADQPYVITYGDDGKDRHKRDKKDKKRTRRSKKKNKKRRRRRRNICKRHELYVDFRDVGWNDWIVAPPGYDAFYCHGDCPFYLPDNLNTTNHAVVQSLVHSVNPQAVPKPCCVPTELSPMSMLYMNYDDNVVLKTYRDMVVEACGCR